MNKLTIEQCQENSLQNWRHISERAVYKQLADTLCENERLREALQFFLLATDSWKTDDAFHDARINARKVLSNKESND